MDFKDIELTDKPSLQPFLINNPWGICDLSFGNLYMWQSFYKTQYCIYNGALIIRATAGDGKRVYMYPLGNDNVLPCLTEYDDNICLSGVTPAVEARLNEVMPGAFSFTHENTFCDYVYLSADLRLLKGRKYNAKRNHINKFLSMYRGSYEYKDITSDITADCLALNERWRQERNRLESGHDYAAVNKALNSWDALKLTGGALYVYGELAAFTFGQPNNKDTYNIMAEKALKSIDGAYAMINREFALKNCEGYIHINREEDMGQEELMKAKMSYRPHILLTKARGYLR